MKEKIKVYDNLQALFDDGIIQHSDILVFFGKRGCGKSALQAIFNVWFMQSRNAKADVRASQAMCERINMVGLNLRAPEDHLVFVDTYVESKGHGLKKTRAYEFASLEFGLPNEAHPTGILCPYGKYSFDEGQKQFDSHMGNLAIFLSLSLELSRHPELFIMIAMQRPKRLPLDVRELSTFITPIKLENFYSKYGRLERTELICLIFYKNKKVEKYLEEDDENFEDIALADKVIKICFRGNIFNCYDSHYFLPIFYALQGSKVKENTLRLERCKKPEFTPEGFEDFHQRHKVDIPETMRGKKPKEDKK